MNNDWFRIVEWVNGEGNIKILVYDEKAVDYPFPTELEVFPQVRLTRQQIKELLPHLNRIATMGN